MTSCVAFGSSWGPIGRNFGDIWRRLGRHLDALLALEAVFWVLQQSEKQNMTSCVAFGSIWGPLGRHLGALWTLGAVFWIDQFSSQPPRQHQQHQHHEEHVFLTFFR